jgi:hypothetical protein
MKYFKFAQISQDTGISWAIAQPISGPSWPEITGLNASTSIQLAHNPTYYIAQVGDSAVANPDNHIFELTAGEYAEQLKQHVMYQLNKEKDSIYQEEYNFRQSIFSKYHDTASTAGIYKYEQAKALVADATAAALDVRAEATARGVAPSVMAARIITNHEDFRAKEAKIAGIRGKIFDRISAYEFNLEDASGSYADFLTENVIGTMTNKVFENGEMVDKVIDVKVRKYQLDLGARFQYE